MGVEAWGGGTKEGGGATVWQNNSWSCEKWGEWIVDWTEVNKQGDSGAEAGLKVRLEFVMLMQPSGETAVIYSYWSWRTW